MRDRLNRRTLAYFDASRRRIVTEQGETIPARTWAAIADALFSHDLVLYVSRLTDPPLWDAVDDDTATIGTRQDGTWIGIAVRRGRKVRHVYDAGSAWGRNADASLLADVRALYAHFGVRGAPSTASGLGIATMRRYWSGETMGRPTYACWRDLHGSLVGGRVDTLQPGTMFPTLYELDINDAYPTAAGRPLPGGSAVRWAGAVREPGPEWGAVTGYYLCDVTIHRGLTLGPVVIRGEDGEPNLIPTQPGRYRGWMWAEDIVALRAQAYGPERRATVVPLHGWYWRRWARAFRSTPRGVVAEPSPLSAWARRMHRARRQLPASLAGMVKLAAVAGLGRFAAGMTSYRVVRSRLSPDDRQITDASLGVTDLFLHADERDSATALIQIASYVQAAVRRQLWERALPYAEAGALVATNYDALYVSTRPRGRTSRRAGDWKLERLQDAWIPAARHLRSREKVRLPGVPIVARPLDTGTMITT